MHHQYNNIKISFLMTNILAHSYKNWWIMTISNLCYMNVVVIIASKWVLNYKTIEIVPIYIFLWYGPNWNSSLMWVVDLWHGSLRNCDFYLLNSIPVVNSTFSLKSFVPTDLLFQLGPYRKNPHLAEPEFSLKWILVYITLRAGCFSFSSET